jgi:hypothetical protein
VGPPKDSQLYLEKNMTETQEEAMKRQVIDAWKNMKAKKDGINEALGIQEPCNCCRYYGLPCLQNKSSEGKIEVPQDQQTEGNKKRKAISLEPLLSVEPNLSSTLQLDLAPNSHQTHSYLEELDAPSATLAMPEICLDGWTITYTEFQPRKSNQAKKRNSEETPLKVNPQNQQVSSTSVTPGTSIQGAQCQDNTYGKMVSNACYQCHEEGHHKKHCPKKYPVRDYVNGRLNHVDLCTAREAQNVVFGSILVNSTPATVLFDSSSSHSFISNKCVANHKMLLLEMKKPVLVKSPRGKIKATHMCPKVSLGIKGVNFEVNLVVLESMEIDVVLGRGWLTACHGKIDCTQHSVSLTTPSGDRFMYEGIQLHPKN